MTKIEIERAGEFPDFAILLKAFPELSARTLGYIGKQAAMQLYEEHLRGQDIQYHSPGSATEPPKDIKGRRLVSYSIGRGLKWVAVSSYPLNLYEKRKQLRSGDEARRGILRKKFKSKLSGRITSYIGEVEKFIFDDWFNKNKRGGMKL